MQICLDSAFRQSAVYLARGFPSGLSDFLPLYLSVLSKTPEKSDDFDSIIKSAETAAAMLFVTVTSHLASDRGDVSDNFMEDYAANISVSCGNVFNLCFLL